MSEKVKSIGARLKKAVGEVSLIMVGILGAFAVEGWREDQEKQELKADVLALTFSEIENNYCNVKKAHKHHTWALEEFNVIKEDSTDAEILKAYNVVYAQGVFKPGLVSTSAWDTAKTTGAIRYVDLDSVIAISAFYYQSTYVDDNFQSIKDAMMNATIRKSDKTDLIKGQAFAMQDLWWSERRFIRQFEAKFSTIAAKYDYALQGCSE